MLKQAVILAGGKGTRLSSVSQGLPKALMPVNGQALIYHQLNLLKKYKINDVLLLTGFLGEKIEAELKDGSHIGMNISYLKEEKPLGTAGALLSAYAYLKETFIILYADTLLSINIKLFTDFHFQYNSDITIFAHPNSHPYDSDIIEVNDNNRVIAFHSSPHAENKILPNLVNAALYIIKKETLSSLKPNYGDICKDLFPKILFNGYKIFAYNSPEYIKDMGTPERYLQVQKDFELKISKNKDLNTKRAAIFLDRDGTINQHKSHITQFEQISLIPGTVKAIQEINKSNYLAVLITNQPVIAKGMCSLNELKRIHWYIETQLGRKGAYLDRIYFCPHHPEVGYAGEVSEFKIQCSCRKPQVGLLEKAIKELNINNLDSWFIGDSTVDIECAKRMNIKSILVKTGENGEDFRYIVKPDFIFSNLKEAINFINYEYENLKQNLLPIANLLKNKSLINICENTISQNLKISSTLKQLLSEQNKKSTTINFNYFLNKNIKFLEKNKDYNINNIINKIINRKNDVLIDIPVQIKSKNNSYLEKNYKLEVKKDDIIIFEDFLPKEIHNKCDYKILFKNELNKIIEVN